MLPVLLNVCTENISGLSGGVFWHVLERVLTCVSLLILIKHSIHSIKRADDSHTHTDTVQWKTSDATIK